MPRAIGTTSSIYLATCLRCFTMALELWIINGQSASVTTFIRGRLKQLTCICSGRLQCSPLWFRQSHSRKPSLLTLVLGRAIQLFSDLSRGLGKEAPHRSIPEDALYRHSGKYTANKCADSHCSDIRKRFFIFYLLFYVLVCFATCACNNIGICAHILWTIL